MSVVEKLLTEEPFSLSHEEKIQLYETELGNLTKNSYANCSIYKKILDILAYDASAEHKIEEFPFLPVRLFKEYDLLNVPKETVVKTMTSSGTTGQRVSKIYLDRTTSTNQTKVLTKICSEFLGNKRRPMLIIDSKSVLKDRNMFSARGAGIIGFSMLGRGATYALDEDLHLDLDAVNAFLGKYAGEPITLFGFTSIIWEHFFKELERVDTKLPLDGAVVIHGGGWKKLIDQQVDNEIFKKSLASRCGDITVLNYYGMVEQTGSIFMECECGRLHASNYSDVIIRNPDDFSVCGVGETGIVQLVSLLPESYPGHSILTEDIGELIGEDDCPCGRHGKTFVIHGRIKNAEIRGCSDTYERK
mgnify:CR=1 FL=1